MQDLKLRTRRFATDCWRLCTTIPRSREYDAWVRQLIKSLSSVGANYRASQRANSTADFINKLKIVEEKVDESIYWLELFLEVMNEKHLEMTRLKNEGEELLTITVDSIKTAKTNRKL